MGRFNDFWLSLNKRAVVQANESANGASSNSDDNAPPAEVNLAEGVRASYVQDGPFSHVPKNTRTSLGLSEVKLRHYSTDELLVLLSEVHPDVSYAVWNFMRLGCSDYRIKVEDKNGNRYPIGDKVIREFIRSLEYPTGKGFQQTKSIDRVIQQMFRTAVIRGAVSGELVLTGNRMQATHIAPIDPQTITFRIKDGRMVPWQNTKELDFPNIFYEGLDTMPDSPYGTSPIISAIQAVFFQLQILADLKAVVHNIGYPKFDIKVVEKVLLERMPHNIRGNDKLKQQWLNERLTEIISMYSKLEPDAAFVHYDSVEVDSVGGEKALIDPEKLMNVVNEQLNMSLKTLSTIMGRRSQGNTETFAKVEIKLYLKGLDALQWLVETVMSRMLTMVLNFSGKQGYVKFEFEDAEIRTNLEAQQFKQIQIQNAMTLRDQNWVSNEDACREVTGQDPVGDPPPPQPRGTTPQRSGTPDERPT